MEFSAIQIDVHWDSITYKASGDVLQEKETSMSSSGMTLTSRSTWLDIMASSKMSSKPYRFSLLISSRSLCTVDLVSGWPLADHARITAS
jgi:hypothetical protein